MTILTIPPVASTPYVGRLAPAPTGALHPGNARTFLIAALRARRAGGRLILRLENLDHPKVKPHAAAECYRDLRWLGLDWDAGPAASFPPVNDADPAGDQYVQSERSALYKKALDHLRRDGKIYPCVCTRKDLDQYASAPNAGEDLHERRYPGLCRGRFRDAAVAAAHAGREPAWRFRLDDDAAVAFDDGFHGRQTGRPGEWSGDFPIARGDQAGYQLAVVVDDHAMGVTEVVRGDDLLPSTERQLFLYAALGLTPPRFYHVPLVVGPDGRRLAKRHGDTRLSCLRQAGRGPERLLGWLARSCGWCGTLREMSFGEVESAADFSRIPHDPAVLTPEDAVWIGF